PLALPTALLTHNDTVALGAMHGLREQGKRVPEDVSVVGCDDTEICTYLAVPLTSIALPKRELGQRAAAILLAAVGNASDEGDLPQRVSLPTELVVRKSTAPPRGPRGGNRGPVSFIRAP